MELLAEVLDFCEASCLRYCLYAGTLLGAVRHKGFIPGDDATDDVMSRPDSRTRFVEPGVNNPDGCGIFFDIIPVMP